MGKLRWQIVGLIMVSFTLMAINSNNAFAGGIPHDILSKLETIQQTLDDQVIPKLDHCCGGVPKTGQTKSFTPGDDGDLQIGLDDPFPRFTDNGDGTVTDNRTHLMWTKDMQEFPDKMNFVDAVAACDNLDFADYDDWRLPNVRELLSLIDYGRRSPALPENNLFINVRSDWHWSSTTRVWSDGSFTNHSLVVNIGHGDSGGSGRGYAQCVWAVRGGN